MAGHPRSPLHHDPSILARPLCNRNNFLELFPLTHSNDTRSLRRYSPQEPQWKSRHHHWSPFLRNALMCSGGAQGIGAAAVVEIFVNAGAIVVFADMNITGGKSVEQKVERYTSLGLWRANCAERRRLWRRIFLRGLQFSSCSSSRLRRTDALILSLRMPVYTAMSGG